MRRASISDETEYLAPVEVPGWQHGVYGTLINVDVSAINDDEI